MLAITADWVQTRLRAADRPLALCLFGGDARRLRAVGLPDQPLFPEFARQRHSAGDRRAPFGQPNPARAAGVVAGRGRQNPADAARLVVRRLGRPRRPDRSGRRLDHVLRRPHVAAPPARAGSRRRGRRRCRRLQHAAGRHRVRHRGDEPQLRGPRQRPHHLGGHRRRSDHPRPRRRLYLFRPHHDDAAEWHRLARGADMRRDRRLRRRPVQPVRHHHGGRRSRQNRRRIQKISAAARWRCAALASRCAAWPPATSSTAPATNR